MPIPSSCSSCCYAPSSICCESTLSCSSSCYICSSIACISLSLVSCSYACLLCWRTVATSLNFRYSRTMSVKNFALSVSLIWYCPKSWIYVSLPRTSIGMIWFLCLRIRSYNSAIFFSILLDTFWNQVGSRVGFYSGFDEGGKMFFSFL